MNKYIIILSLVLLPGCSSVIIKPDTFDKNAGKVFVQHGGYQMRHAIKDSLEKRGYDLTVGKVSGSKKIVDEGLAESANDNTIIFDARYVVKVSEDNYNSLFDPIICFASGFDWWKFNVSISDQETQKEILSWTARGCSASMMDRLETYLDTLEKDKN